MEMKIKSDLFLILFRILEKNFHNQKQDYEKKMELLRAELQFLKGENDQLQSQVQEELQFQNNLKVEVAELTNQAKVS